jgi:pyruvate ferredoxin oxidoreductase gamma subunit
MTAYTRIDRDPILERGVIASPDLIVIADDTLLDDEAAKPLQGVMATGAVLINSTRSAEVLRHRYAIVVKLAALDFTDLVLAHIGSMAALSVAMAAGACRLAGLSQEGMEEAVRGELESLGLEAEQIEKNVELARVCYQRIEALPPLPYAEWPSQAPAPKPGLMVPAYLGPMAGTASVAAPANTPLRRTGSWRVWRPMIDLEQCSQCWICFVSCPEGAISLDEVDNPHVDYEVCKGCLVCVEECPTHAIHKEREARE